MLVVLEQGPVLLQKRNIFCDLTIGVKKDIERPSPRLRDLRMSARHLCN